MLKSTLTGLDKSMLLKEVYIHYPDHTVSLVFGEWRTSLEDYIKAVKNELRRIDHYPDEVGTTIMRLQEVYHLRIRLKFTFTVSTSLDDITYVQKYQNVHEGDGMIVVI